MARIDHETGEYLVFARSAGRSGTDWVSSSWEEPNGTWVLSVASLDFEKWPPVYILIALATVAVGIFVASLIYSILQQRERLRLFAIEMEQIIEQGKAPFVGIARDGRINVWNEAIAELLGVPGERALGKSISAMVDVATSIASLEAALQAALNDAPTTNHESHLITQSGEQVKVIFSVGPRLDALGNIVGAVAMGHDITEHSQMQAMLQEQAVLRAELRKERELSEVRSRFIETASHEFRTPLAVVVSSAGLIRLYLEKNGNSELLAKTAKHLDRIEKSSDHLTDLMSRLLTFNQSQADMLPFNPAPLDVEQLCREIARETNALSGVDRTLVVNSTGEKRTVEMDETLLRDILRNLVDNAIKFSSDGSTINLDLTWKPDQIVLCIEDNGIGIPADEQSRIFDPFYRASNIGTVRGVDLGLSIAKEAVEKHGGTITFESTEDDGSVFTVTLPTSPPKDPDEV